MIDVVFPENNEKDFILMAERLGFSGLVFVYSSRNKFFLGAASIKVSNALLAPEKKMEHDVVVFVRSPIDSRFVFEKAKPNCVFDLELGQRDFIHQRGSGLNHVAARFAHLNDVAVGFSFRTILNSSPVERSRIIGRMRQNIILCRKYGVKIVVASFALSPFEMRSPHDLMSFFVLLGMHPKDARDSLDRDFRRKSVVEL